MFLTLLQIVDTRGGRQIQKRTPTIRTIIIAKEPFDDARTMKGFFTAAMPHKFIAIHVGFKTNEALRRGIHILFLAAFISVVHFLDEPFTGNVVLIISGIFLLLLLLIITTG